MPVGSVWGSGAQICSWQHPAAVSAVLQPRLSAGGQAHDLLFVVLSQFAVCHERMACWVFIEGCFPRGGISVRDINSLLVQAECFE